MNGVTMLADLPDIDAMMDQEAGMNEQHPHGLSQDSLNKHIRNSHKFNPESGMSMRAAEMYQPQEIPQPPPQNFRAGIDPMSLNCVSVSDHIHACPVCSKIYSSDKTAYIIAIILLSIVCLLLLKKVLNV